MCVCVDVRSMGHGCVAAARSDRTETLQSSGDYNSQQFLHLLTTLVTQLRTGLGAASFIIIIIIIINIIIVILTRTNQT